MEHTFKKLLVLQLFFALAGVFVSESSAENFVGEVPKDESTKEDVSRRLLEAENMGKYIFETRMADFSRNDYDQAVGALFKAYEKVSGVPIKRGKRGKVGIKIYTNSGAGLCTSPKLVDAVIEELGRRGYAREDITLVDMTRRKIRSSGFLPKVSELREGAEDSYGGVKVADIESGKFFDKKWYYDNPLQPKVMHGNIAADRDVYNPERRKSYLPVPLFLTVDFWINLPVVTDMEGLGVCCAIGNASIWNMSNNERFLKSPSNASVAAAEVCAIPELKDSHLFTILSLERGQFVGGSVFNSRFTFSERSLILSSDPVAIDCIAWELINKYRRVHGFKTMEDLPSLLDSCKQLELGDWDLRLKKRIIVPYGR